MFLLSQILYTILLSWLFIYVTSIAFSFFGIGFEVYGNYLLWIIALVIFWSILPSDMKGSIFSKRLK